MSKIDEAKQILAALGLPKAQQNERSALTLLSLCGLKESDAWKDARQVSMSVVGSKKNARYPGIMRFMAEHYDKRYAENSRETIRRQTLHQFEQARVVNLNPENPSLATNSKDNHYCLTKEAQQAIKKFGTKEWNTAIKKFGKDFGFLKAKYEGSRKIQMQTVRLEDGTELQFSPGKHNEVEIAIITEFAPRFAKGSVILYVGDTANKDLYVNVDLLTKLKIPFDQHSKLPDVVLYDATKDWLYLIESVTSHGPVSPKRIIELQAMLKGCTSGRVYVTAFPSLNTFKKFVQEIAWDTEIWIADPVMYEHMIHFNGDKFIGPRD